MRDGRRSRSSSCAWSSILSLALPSLGLAADAHSRRPSQVLGVLRRRLLGPVLLLRARAAAVPHADQGHGALPLRRLRRALLQPVQCVSALNLLLPPRAAGRHQQSDKADPRSPPPPLLSSPRTRSQPNRVRQPRHVLLLPLHRRHRRQPRRRLLPLPRDGRPHSCARTSPPARDGLPKLTLPLSTRPQSSSPPRSSTTTPRSASTRRAPTPSRTSTRRARSSRPERWSVGGRTALRSGRAGGAVQLDLRCRA